MFWSVRFNRRLRRWTQIAKVLSLDSIGVHRRVVDERLADRATVDNKHARRYSDRVSHPRWLKSCVATFTLWCLLALPAVALA